jgi:hypothetical protein
MMDEGKTDGLKRSKSKQKSYGLPCQIAEIRLHAGLVGQAIGREPIYLGLFNYGTGPWGLSEG